jgi:hypothetical protein
MTSGTQKKNIFMLAFHFIQELYDNDLLGMIGFIFCMINSKCLRLISSNFHRPSIGTTDDSILSLMIHK